MTTLTDLTVRTAKPREKAYKLSDGKGLYLLVKPAGSKLWRLKYHFLDREKKLSLGAYPEVTLAQARERQLEARRQLGSGIDPAAYRKQARRSAKVAASNTFEAIGREWFEKFSRAGNWAPGHSSKVLLRLENDLFPWLGDRPIAEIEATELLEVIQRIEARGAVDSAHRCLSYCGRIFRYAIATAGRAKRDVAADLRGALPPVEGGHFPSITEPQGIGELLRAIDGYTGQFVTRCALRLAPLTFVRPKELRTAEWPHINFETAEWRLPGKIMKMKQDFIVPLSRQALEVLLELHPKTGHRRYLFPCQRTLERPMSANTVNGALRRLGYSTEEMCGHGFRAMARTVLDEELGVRVEWIEMQLAHKVKDTNGRAYNRTSFLPGRKQMMQQWADHLDGLRAAIPPGSPQSSAAPTPGLHVPPMPPREALSAPVSGSGLPPPSGRSSSVDTP